MKNRLIIHLLVVWVLALGSSAHAQKSATSVFIGRETRDGFIDMDAGIRDSIRDIQQECQQAGVTVARTADEAAILLVVIGRGMPVKGSVGFASSVAAAL
jgi:hypothetical protein